MELLHTRLDIVGDLNPLTLLCYLLLITVLSLLSGFVPATLLSRYNPLDIVKGTFRRKTKTLYLRLLNIVQNGLTIAMLNYQTHVDKGSMFNTPPVVPIYAALQTLRWIKAQGGVEEMQRRAKQRADMLYAEIDRNKLFRGTVTAKEDRSYMNICFVMADEYKDLEADFLKFATEKGMVGIKGHRSVGGFRASCYNAMPVESVQALIDCMQEFEKMH